MPDLNPKLMPENYRRIEGSEHRPAPGTRLVREADPNQALPVVIRVKASAGQAGLEQVAAFARAQGMRLVEINVDERSVIVWGTVAQMREIFAVGISVYESPTETYRACEGHLHLPAALAEVVDNVLGMVERQMHDIEGMICKLLGRGAQPGSGEPHKVIFDLVVPLSGPAGAVKPAEFSLVQEFDVDWLLAPGYQRLLANLQASPVAFQTVRVMKVFTSGTAETGIEGTSSGGTVWPAGAPSASIDFTVTLNALAELTSRGLIPFVVLGFFPDGIYNGTSYQGASPLPGPTGPSSATIISGADWTAILTNWQTLVQAFFTALIGDPRFGAGAIAQWWFEV